MWSRLVVWNVDALSVAECHCGRPKHKWVSSSTDEAVCMCGSGSICVGHVLWSVVLSVGNLEFGISCVPRLRMAHRLKLGSDTENPVWGACMCGFSAAWFGMSSGKWVLAWAIQILKADPVLDGAWDTA